MRRWRNKCVANTNSMISALGRANDSVGIISTIISINRDLLTEAIKLATYVRHNIDSGDYVAARASNELLIAILSNNIQVANRVADHGDSIGLYGQQNSLVGALSRAR